jgi:hypothetical protein
MIVSGAQPGGDPDDLAQARRCDRCGCVDVPRFKTLAETLHLKLLPIPVTDQGLICRPSKAVPDSFGTGRLRDADAAQSLGLGDGDRTAEQLVSIARRHDLTIIEDAAYAFWPTTFRHPWRPWRRKGRCTFQACRRISPPGCASDL